MGMDADKRGEPWEVYRPRSKPISVVPNLITTKESPLLSRINFLECCTLEAD